MGIHRKRRQAPVDFGGYDATPVEEAAKTVTSVESAPTTLDHGVDVEGLEEVLLSLVATSTTAWTVSIWIVPAKGTASDWTEVASDELSGTVKGDAQVFSVKAARRFAARVTSLTGTSLRRVISGA